MVIEVSNQLAVTNPTPELIRWCKRNLELANPEYSRRVRMNLWTGNTPQKIALYTTEDVLRHNRERGIMERTTVYRLPFGTLSMLPREITEQAVFIRMFPSSPDIDYKADIPLYDYQETAVRAMIDAKFGILQSAAGSGKTQMGIAIAARTGKRTLWLCHTVDLINQSMERAKRYMSENLLGTITAGKVNIGRGITFATVQTMSKLDLPLYRDYWDCIIVDEVHRVSGSPTHLTMYQKVLNNLAARHKYGLSATVHRADGLITATYALIGTIAYQVPDEAVADKIMGVGIHPIATGVKLHPKCLNTDGTLNYTGMITYLTENTERNRLIADCIERRPSLILSDRLSQLATLMDMLPEDMRQEAVLINGKMTSKKGKTEREQAIEDMRTGKKKYLFATYSLAKEGLDIPCLERLYMATPQKDYAIITQSIGRIARTCEGKADPICYDFVDDMPYLVRAYKKRWTTYRKNNCYSVVDT